MAKKVTDDVLDAALDAGAACDNLAICSGEPTDPTNISSVSLGSTTLTAGAGNGDWASLANGDTSGRKLTLLEQTISITTTGTATHVVAYTGVTSNDTMLVTTCTSQSVTSSESWTVPQLDFLEVEDPT